MTKLRFTLQALALSVFMLALASLAQAQATRTWVSGVGDDVNPCSRTAPCKTWAGAISKTAAGGEIDALDPGGFGTLTITKSIMVDGTNGQGFGSTLNSGGINGFVINDSLTASPNTIKVVLRNLSINGAGTTLGLNGIRALAFSRLTVENVTIDNQSNNGIDIVPGALVKVDLRNVSVNNCGANGVNAGAANTAVVTIADSSFRNNGTGVRAGQNSRVQAIRTVASNNTTNGFIADSAVAGFAELNLVDCSAYGQSGTGRGIVAGGTTTGHVIRMAGTSSYINGTGVLVVAGNTVNTYGNNMINGNGTDISGALTAFPVGQGLR